jgi:hypothetical protein
MILIDGALHCEHVQIIKCDIRLRLLEKSRDVEYEVISEKIQRE